MLAASTSAWSISQETVGSTDDLLIGTVLPNSGDDDEAGWVSDILGFDVTFGSKLEDMSLWESVDGIPDLYAFDFSSLGSEPAYFLVKTGGGKGYEGDTHFL